jgi:drug/metabolite transporter (DMT)-like permease
MKALHQLALPVAFVLVWSSAYVAGSIATALIAPLTVTLWRFAVAALLLGGVAWLRREPWPRGARALGGAVATGVLLFALQFASLYLALADHMPVATTALIACSAPLLVAALSALLGWERLALRQWWGVALGVLGVVITLSDRLGRPPSAAALGWALLGLSGLVGGTLLQGRLRIAAGPAALASVELAAAALVLALSAPFAGSLAIPLTTPALLAFGYVAVVAGAGAPLLFFALIRQRGATRASSLLFVVPSVTALCAWLVLGTPIGMAALLGFVTAGGGLLLARAGARPEAHLAPAVAGHAITRPA